MLLGYTQAFTRVTQWHNQAQYEFEPGQVCGFRVYQDRESELEFVVYYSASTPVYGRKLFQGLFEKFLYERDVQVTRLMPVTCPNGHQQQRAILTERRREGKEFVFCGECGRKVLLADAGAAPDLGASLSRQVQRQDALARLRSSYEANLALIKAYRRDRAAPRCYLSHADGSATWAGEMARALRDAGIIVAARWEDLGPDDFILIGATDAYWRAWPESADPVATDAAEIRRRVILGHAGSIIPLLIEGERFQARLAELGITKSYDFRDDTRLVLTMFDLILTLYAISLGHSAFNPLRQAMQEQWREMLPDLEPLGARFPAAARREVFVSYAWDDESTAVVTELDWAFRNEGILVVQDKRDLQFKGDIRAFMQRIGQGKCVIIVLSDKYLKSENCLFELLEIAKHGSFSDRIFPVVLESARIYKALDRIRYVQYWEEQVARLEQAFRTVSAANLHGFREEIDLYTEIRAELPRLADILKNLNALSPEIQRESGYTAIVDAVMRRLES